MLAVAGALVFRAGPAGRTSSEPPIIQADGDPLKIKPENPGGVEIPNQNAQVYEPGGADKQTRVVNREEQPIDVQQAARMAQPNAAPARLVAGSTATPGSVPAAPPLQLAPNNVMASLGEPRRVRTVSVRPDGTVIPAEPAQTSSAPPPAPAAAPLRPATTSAIPAPPQTAAPSATAPSTPAQSAPAQRASDTRSATPAPAVPQQPSASAASAPPPTAPLQIAPSVAQQASTPPQRTAAAAPPRAAAPAETVAATGGFAVQLSVATTEEAARGQAQALQRKYAGELGGRSAMIRMAEVNGKTLYRVRVGPMARDDATELCTKVKSAGGACFVAKN
jgi:hypothetical protein